jgi:hypothetical protein
VSKNQMKRRRSMFHGATIQSRSGAQFVNACNSWQLRQELLARDDMKLV